MEPLATPDTGDHLTVPGAPASAVAVDILKNKFIIHINKHIPMSWKSR